MHALFISWMHLYGMIKSYKSFTVKCFFLLNISTRRMEKKLLLLIMIITAIYCGSSS